MSFLRYISAFESRLIKDRNCKDLRDSSIEFCYPFIDSFSFENSFERFFWKTSEIFRNSPNSSPTPVIKLRTLPFSILETLSKGFIGTERFYSISIFGRFAAIVEQITSRRTYAIWTSRSSDISDINRVQSSFAWSDIYSRRDTW